MIQFPFKLCLIPQLVGVHQNFLSGYFYSANYRKGKQIVKAHWWLLSDCWTYTADKHENGLTSRWIKWNLQSPLHMSSVYPLLTWSKCLKISLFDSWKKRCWGGWNHPSCERKPETEQLFFSLPSSSRWVMAKIISYTAAATVVATIRGFVDVYRVKAERTL